METILQYKPIGIIQTPFKEKFGIPRQPGLVKGALGIIKLNRSLDLKKSLRGLEEFSHIWILFDFHKSEKNNKKSIRPPRLGGNKKIGIFSSRSPHRPNTIGMSAVKLLKITESGEVWIQGVDLLDQTPILDIKPYLSYCDSYPKASSGWAKEKIKKYKVKFTKKALKIIEKEKSKHPLIPLKKFLVEMLCLDPRPAFQKRKFPIESGSGIRGDFGIMLLDYDVKWHIKDDFIQVHDLLLTPYIKNYSE
jgi:tRNA-Thr(GGU) m(6)t(6)A37 methyltransferase TsaA